MSKCGAGQDVFRDYVGRGNRNRRTEHRSKEVNYDTART